MSVDKTQVREDYMKGLSVRMLSAKYGVPKSTVNDWIKKYGWVQESKPKYVSTKKAIREALKESDTCPVSPDTLNNCPDIPDTPPELPPLMAATKEFELIRAYTMKLLGKADQLLDLDDALAPRDLKSLSSMLLDVRQLLNTMSPLEEEERRLRMMAMRKQMEEKEKEQEKASAEVVVRFVDTEGAQI